MRALVFSISLITFIFSSSSFAGPTPREIFLDMWDSPKISSRHCGVNTQLFLSELYKRGASFNNAYAISVHEDVGALNHFDARWGGNEQYENGETYRRANYYFHVFAVVDGKAYDFSQAGKKSSELEQYLKDSYIPKSKTGNIFFQGRLTPEGVLKDTRQLKMSLYPGKSYAREIGRPLYTGRFIEAFGPIVSGPGAGPRGKKVFGRTSESIYRNADGSVTISSPKLITEDGTLPVLASEADLACKAFGHMGSMPSGTRFEVTENRPLLKLFSFLDAKDPMDIVPDRDFITSYRIRESDIDLASDKFHYATQIRCSSFENLFN